MHIRGALLHYCCDGWKIFTIQYEVQLNNYNMPFHSSEHSSMSFSGHFQYHLRQNIHVHVHVCSCSCHCLKYLECALDKLCSGCTYAITVQAENCTCMFAYAAQDGVGVHILLSMQKTFKRNNIMCAAAIFLSMA